MSAAPSLARHRVATGAARGAQRVGAVRSFVAPQRSLAPRTISCRVSQGSEVDMEDMVERFMKRQAELESGAAFARTRDTGEVLGADVVNDELAQQYCAEIFEVLRTLKRTRDMSVAEVKLVVSIEDPRTRERRVMADVEDDRGVSRDEMAVALAEVAEGRVPLDRIALQCLWEEIYNWPFLEMGVPVPAPGSDGAPAPVPQKTLPSEYASELSGADTIARPYVMGEEARKGDKPQGLSDMLPSWIGLGALYGISSIPPLLVIGCLIILFVNSLH
ncbi:hypothetical protein FOA52_000803 [Chlamydomonas sp. UWO 241]|nr:hypothetical protein FOA52_000803 [Chlamydomonas sp. UWO 241]